MTPTAPAGSRELPHPASEEIRLEGVLHALADPMRLQIVSELAAAGGAELTCSQFAVPVAKSTTTHHFRVLREAGVIRQVYRGTAKMNGLRGDDLNDRFPGLLDALLAAAARQAVGTGVPGGSGASGS
ncbi:helix-turn-helix transcriptional regulator [Streptomyces sp. NPDC006458]|uniref:ArsR/SmtB family transcription factor n=1 Tax=Streptomyces sp. NPDC006458 TaxID=3154302 RepID=UPI0033A86391